MRIRHWAAALAASALVVACGGGEVIAVVSFLGSVGGDWRVDNPAQAGFQQRADCGSLGDEDCAINIQLSGARNLYGSDFAITFTGNLPGCPRGSGADPARAGTVSGDRLSLPGCFVGRYVTINEALSDNGLVRAYFDSEVPDLTTGIWVEIQDERRRFKFKADPDIRDITNVAGCELTSPATTGATLRVEAARIDIGRLQTDLTLTVGGETWSGRFEGISGMRLTRGNLVMELERRDLTFTGNC